MSVLKHNFTQSKSCIMIDPLTYWFRRRFSGFHEIQCKLQSQTIFHAIGKISTINYDEANQHWEWNIHKTKKNSLNWSTVSTFSLCETDFGLFSSDDFIFLWIVRMFLSCSCSYFFFHFLIIWCFYSVILIHVQCGD